MSLAFENMEYEDNHTCVSWRGLKFINSDTFFIFLIGEVANRLDDTSEREDFSNHLKDLSLTGMGQHSLEAVLNADVSEERSWAAGEALAEAYLMQSYGVIFPWNMERDKRNPYGSLPGADIVGFIDDGEGYRFVLGEVKSSSELKNPPKVMHGRSGMIGQIDELSNNLTMIYQLLKWLHPRVKGTDYESAFDQAATTFFNSGNKSLSIFGVLIRDTPPNELDLSNRGKFLRNKIVSPMKCNLIALYLPWDLKQLISYIRNGGVS